MRREKGKAIENWNWQAHESKYGADSDISSEYDIISNYYQSESSYDESVAGFKMTPGGVKNRKRGFSGKASVCSDFADR